MSIHKDDKVKVVIGARYYSIFGDQIGRVLRTYDFDGGVAIVEFLEGTTAKVPFADLIKIEPKKTETETSEIPEGAKRISKADYDRAIIAVANPTGEGMSNFLGNMVAMIVAKDIRSKIFEKQDAVIMTEDQFITTLWNGCSPENVSKSVDNEMSFYECTSVSLPAMSNLRKAVNILFGESEND